MTGLWRPESPGRKMKSAHAMHAPATLIYSSNSHVGLDTIYARPGRDQRMSVFHRAPALFGAQNEDDDLNEVFTVRPGARARTPEPEREDDVSIVDLLDSSDEETASKPPDTASVKRPRTKQTTTTVNESIQNTVSSRLRSDSNVPEDQRNVVVGLWDAHPTNLIVKDGKLVDLEEFVSMYNEKRGDASPISNNDDGKRIREWVYRKIYNANKSQTKTEAPAGGRGVGPGVDDTEADEEEADPKRSRIGGLVTFPMSSDRVAHAQWRQFREDAHRVIVSLKGFLSKKERDEYSSLVAEQMDKFDDPQNNDEFEQYMTCIMQGIVKDKSTDSEAYCKLLKDANALYGWDISTRAYVKFFGAPPSDDVVKSLIAEMTKQLKKVSDGGDDDDDEELGDPASQLSDICNAYVVKVKAMKQTSAAFKKLMDHVLELETSLNEWKGTASNTIPDNVVEIVRKVITLTGGKAEAKKPPPAKKAVEKNGLFEPTFASKVIQDELNRMVDPNNDTMYMSSSQLVELLDNGSGGLTADERNHARAAVAVLGIGKNITILLPYPSYWARLSNTKVGVELMYLARIHTYNPKSKRFGVGLIRMYLDEFGHRKDDAIGQYGGYMGQKQPSSASDQKMFDTLSIDLTNDAYETMMLNWEAYNTAALSNTAEMKSRRIPLYDSWIRSGVHAPTVAFRNDDGTIFLDKTDGQKPFEEITPFFHIRDELYDSRGLDFGDRDLYEDVEQKISTYLRIVSTRLKASYDTEMDAMELVLRNIMKFKDVQYIMSSPLIPIIDTDETPKGRDRIYMRSPPPLERDTDEEDDKAVPSEGEVPVDRPRRDGNEPADDFTAKLKKSYIYLDDDNVECVPESCRELLTAISSHHQLYEQTPTGRTKVSYLEVMRDAKVPELLEKLTEERIKFIKDNLRVHTKWPIKNEERVLDIRLYEYQALKLLFDEYDEAHQSEVPAHESEEARKARILLALFDQYELIDKTGTDDGKMKRCIAFMWSADIIPKIIHSKILAPSDAEMFDAAEDLDKVADDDDDYEAESTDSDSEISDDGDAPAKKRRPAKNKEIPKPAEPSGRKRTRKIANEKGESSMGKKTRRFFGVEPSDEDTIHQPPTDEEIEEHIRYMTEESKSWMAWISLVNNPLYGATSIKCILDELVDDISKCYGTDEWDMKVMRYDERGHPEFLVTHIAHARRHVNNMIKCESYAISAYRKTVEWAVTIGVANGVQKPNSKAWNAERAVRLPWAAPDAPMITVIDAINLINEDLDEKIIASENLVTLMKVDSKNKQLNRLDPNKPESAKAARKACIALRDEDLKEFTDARGIHSYVPKSKSIVYPVRFTQDIETWQTRNVKRFMHQVNKNPREGIVIADMPGLGKTASAIRCAVELMQHNRGNNKFTTLVVCPASLQDQWHDEISKMTNANKVHQFSIRSIKGVANRSIAIVEQFAADWVIISYDVLRALTEGGREMKAFETPGTFMCVIYDEAHTNAMIAPDSAIHARCVKISRACMQNPGKKTGVVALTGTPIVHGIIDLKQLAMVVGSEYYANARNLALIEAGYKDVMKTVDHVEWKDNVDFLTRTEITDTIVTGSVPDLFVYVEEFEVPHIAATDDTITKDVRTRYRDLLMDYARKQKLKTKSFTYFKPLQYACNDIPLSLTRLDLVDFSKKPEYAQLFIDSKYDASSTTRNNGLYAEMSKHERRKHGGGWSAKFNKVYEVATSMMNDTYKRGVKSDWDPRSNGEQSPLQTTDGRKIIIFVESVDVLGCIAVMFEERGHRVLTMSGKNNKKLAIHDFFTKDDMRILIMTLGLGTGLNIQVATGVIFVDPDWSSTTHDQCIARSRRMQKNGRSSPGDKLRDVVVSFIIPRLEMPKEEKDTLGPFDTKYLHTIDHWIYTTAEKKRRSAIKIFETIFPRPAIEGDDTREYYVDDTTVEYTNTMKELIMEHFRNTSDPKIIAHQNFLTDERVKKSNKHAKDVLKGDDHIKNLYAEFLKDQSTRLDGHDGGTTAMGE